MSQYATDSVPSCLNITYRVAVANITIANSSHTSIKKTYNTTYTRMSFYSSIKSTFFKRQISSLHYPN